MTAVDEDRIAALLARLRLDEKLSLLAGGDFWHTRAVPRLEIPAIRMTDGPHGVTVMGDRTGPGTCFPTGVGLAATWDTRLLEEVGATLAREAAAYGNRVLLGPSVDLHRHPLNGRNYESYSEDPVLAGRLAAAYVRGVQGQGVAACIKHCTANNQQTEQSRTSSQIAAGPLRELYLRPWELAVGACEPWLIMTSYNLLNGEYTSACRHLLTDIIKDEWGYTGLIVSDWRGVHGVDAAAAGLDLEMPGPGKHMAVANLRPLVDSGALPEECVDDKVRRLLRLLARVGALADAGATADAAPAAARRSPDATMTGAALAAGSPEATPTGELDSPRHRALARRAAEESLVLLKNDGDLLPLEAARLRRLAVIGPNAAEARLGGGGSSSTTPFYAIDPLAGLRARLPDVEVVHVEGCSLQGSLPVVPGDCLRPVVEGAAGLAARYFANPELAGDPALKRTDGQLDFSWGWSSPGGQVPKEDWSARWEGTLTAPRTGRYRLGLSWEGGGVRLFLDGQLRLDAWETPGADTFEARYAARSQTVDVELAADEPVDLRVEFRKLGTRTSLRLEWEAPNAEDPIAAAAAAAAAADAAVVFAGISNRYEGGNLDRTDLDLPGAQNDLIRAVVAAQPRTAVVLINGTPLCVEPWIDAVPAVLEAYYPGQEGGAAIARVLLGDVNPSGKLPETFPRRLEDHPAHGLVPGADGKTIYAEGLFVGYRHYDAEEIEPRFAFGHGLSYTSFAYGDLRLRWQEDGGLGVSVDLTNTGARAGREVVQAYVGDGAPGPRPPRELKAFAKVALEPGERRRVELLVNAADLRWFDEDAGRWRPLRGACTVGVGGSSRQLLRGTIDLGPRPG